MVVTFCGNRDIVNGEHIERILGEIIEELILSGAKEFLFGGYGDFDMLAAKAVKNLKQKYPDIKSVIILPYPNKFYSENLYDYSEYPELEKIHPKLAIVKRNEYMVEKADVVVACVKYESGGSGRTLRFAKRMNKRIIDLTEFF